MSDLPSPEEVRSREITDVGKQFAQQFSGDSVIIEPDKLFRTTELKATIDPTSPITRIRRSYYSRFPHKRYEANILSPINYPARDFALNEQLEILFRKENEEPTYQIMQFGENDSYKVLHMEWNGMVSLMAKDLLKGSVELMLNPDGTPQVLLWDPIVVEMEERASESGVSIPFPVIRGRDHFQLLAGSLDSASLGFEDKGYKSDSYVQGIFLPERGIFEFTYFTPDGTPHQRFTFPQHSDITRLTEKLFDPAMLDNPAYASSDKDAWRGRDFYKLLGVTWESLDLGAKKG